MYDNFDKALVNALSDRKTPFGVKEQGLLIVTARRAAADNRIKAMNEAMLGAFNFAKIHECASIRYHEDAEAIEQDNMPIHHPVTHYFSIAQAYRHDDKDRISCDTKMQVA